MINYYHYRPNSGQSRPETSRNEHVAEAPKRGIFKKLSILFGTVLLALLLVLALGYFYITQTPVANTDSRTNVLLLGVDEAADLSDTIMIMSIRDGRGEPEVAMTSIPRDLWVEVPGFGGSKINAAYALGERHEYPGGGPALTSETLEQVLDADIHYYAALNFEGFESVVDAVGGVEIEVEQAINDPMFPAREGAGYDPFTIEPGVHEMDGELALRYARSRKTTNDFDRAYRQQQIVLGLREEVFGGGRIPRVGEATRLLGAVERHTETNISRPGKLRLAFLLRNVALDETPQYVIDTSNFLTSSPRDGSSLEPRDSTFAEIRDFFDRIFEQDSIEEYESAFRSSCADC